MLDRGPHRSTIVVVPTIELKKQWEAKAKAAKIKNFQVYVINTVVLNEIRLSCHLLILDEIHRFGSEEFIKIFELSTYHFILGLTATMERLDGKHELIEKYAPIVDTITTQEARKNEWIAEYLEYNLGIDFSPVEKAKYDSINKSFVNYFSKFGSDFDLMMSCLSQSEAKKYAERMGWREYFGEKHSWSPKNVSLYAIQGMRYMRERKDFLHKAPCKLDIGELIIKSFNLKTITFSESTEFADALKERIGEVCVAYHSNLKSEQRNVKEKGEKKIKKLSPKALKEEAIKKIKDNRYKVRVVSTARALDEGLDVQDIELVLIFSRTSNPRQQIQRIGRGTRKFKFKDGKDKVALVINIYIKGTQDEKWLKSAQEKSIGMIDISSIGEIEYAKQTLIVE